MSTIYSVASPLHDTLLCLAHYAVLKTSFVLVAWLQQASRATHLLLALAPAPAPAPALALALALALVPVVVLVPVLVLGQCRALKRRHNWWP